ncbi:hypothetical protein MBCUT_11450 [Methanobrevibacter cuticularis]|uniref:Transposase n=1 Tax=Methanobrevibacter cuticularis TaxID=47311 RepID=A0A166DVZ4_9EURY|nr:hypothetical protein [Methanobrevibacter cuticularis]KZX16009.1 hypothetical protein MBCUT_11450 [Methanobrevibacter cuticularis]
MTTISKSAIIDNIGSIQLKLFDCIEEKVDFKTKVVKYAFPHNKKKKINKNIQILDNGNYQMNNPTCPNCGSVKQVKQGFIEINPKIDNCEKIRESKKNRGGPLRKIARDTENFLNLKISHQSIKNFLKIDPKKLKKDERVLFINLSNYQAIMSWMNNMFILVGKRDIE